MGGGTRGRPAKLPDDEQGKPSTASALVTHRGRRVEVPKGKGQIRSLCIPMVLDRLIQQAIAQALTPGYEAIFSERSYGFRPGRGAHYAIVQMHEEALAKGKRCHVVDCDLQAYLRGSINYFAIGISFDLDTMRSELPLSVPEKHSSP